MQQAIAGVAPIGVEEVAAMTVWPSNAAYSLGRWLGRLYSQDYGVYIFTLGNFLCLLSIPAALALYFWRLAPGVGKRYTLTNRRVVEYRSQIRRESNRLWGIPVPYRFYYSVASKAVELHHFDNIEIDVQPGQEWYHAGDLVFRQGQAETFRLEGISRPEAFRQSCLKARLAYVAVKQALEHEAVGA